MSRPGSPVALRAAVTTASGLVAVAGVLGDVGAPVQPMLVLWFVLVCPGMALVGLVRPPSLLFALTLSIAVSCALAVMVSQACSTQGPGAPWRAWSSGRTHGRGRRGRSRADRRAGAMGADTSGGR